MKRQRNRILVREYTPDDRQECLSYKTSMPMTASDPPEPILTPFCGDLRSKRFLMLDAIPTAAEQYYDPSLHCWCYHTQQVIGPDGGPVAPEDCVPGRSCYRSALAIDP